MAKDYSLLCEDAQCAETAGHVNPKWFRADVDPAEIRKLMQKDDRIAARDTLLWLGLMVLFAGLGIALWPSLWSLPFWFAYGTLYGSGGDSRWHEMGHRTAFKTPWMNEAVYQFACFLMMRSPVVWRSSHVRHHTDTVIVGRDPEIIAMRPPDLRNLALNFFGILYTWEMAKRMVLHASGRLDPEEETYVRHDDSKRVAQVARVWIGIYAATLLSAVLMQSILPLLLVGLPRFYGAWHHVMTGVLQHLGLAENVTDHRLNTRTVYMNRLNRFLYLNMNYHLEHHMFTMVPYYNLPKLHALLRADLPEPDPSIIASYSRLWPVLRKQLTHQDAVIIPELPSGATPYGSEVELLRPHAV